MPATASTRAVLVAVAGVLLPPAAALAQGMTMDMSPREGPGAMQMPVLATSSRSAVPSTAEATQTPKNKTGAPPEVSGPDHLDMSMPIAMPMSGAMPAAMTMDMNMDMSGMQGGAAPADARDPDYSDGRRASHLAVHAHTPGNDPLWGVAFDRAEAILTAGDFGGAWEGEAWYGTDRLRAVLSSEGAAGPDGVEDARNELRVRIPYAPFWNVESGVRLDAADGSPVRGWAALGVSGISPYWFHNEAFVYVGDAGRTALRLETRYDLRLNPKWVLVPRAEANLYGRADPALKRGAGLSTTELGLRMRYELVPWFGPYLGIEKEWLYGGTARQAADEGKVRSETRGVAGVKFWF